MVGSVATPIIVACPHPLTCCIYTALILCLAAYRSLVSLLVGTVIPTSFNILVEMFLLPLVYRSIYFTLFVPESQIPAASMWALKSPTGITGALNLRVNLPVTQDYLKKTNFSPCALQGMHISKQIRSYQHSMLLNVISLLHVYHVQLTGLVHKQVRYNSGRPYCV